MSSFLPAATSGAKHKLRARGITHAVCSELLEMPALRAIGRIMPVPHVDYLDLCVGLRMCPSDGARHGPFCRIRPQEP